MGIEGHNSIPENNKKQKSSVEALKSWVPANIDLVLSSEVWKYGFIDGFLGFCLIAWIYNYLNRRE